ncbi:MAG: TolC family protein [Deltaproteobacteria bacterium]
MIFPRQKFQALVARIPAIGTRSMGVRVEPVESARGPRFTLLDLTPWIADAISTVCLIITIALFIAGGVLTLAGPACGAEIKSGAQAPVSGRPLTFEDSVKIAISHSPIFTKSSLEIDIKRMDETDSRYGLIPPLTFSTIYYVNRPGGLTSTPYGLYFSTAPYNPFGSYITLQAQKLITQVAILKHLEVISKGLERLGQFYLKLDALKKTARYQKDLIKLAQENLIFAENRLSIGTGTSLEVKVAQQQLQLDRGELKQLALKTKRYFTGLRNFLGLPATGSFNPEFYNSRHQVLDNFTPTTTTIAQAKSRSYKIKAMEINKKLQGYSVSLAIAKTLPTILFNSQTPDPLSATSASGLYVGFGLQIPVWDGFQRIRNISRQKAILKQVDSLIEVQSNDLENKWYESLSETQDKKLALKVAQSQVELARLKNHQIEARYQSGEVLLPKVLESRIDILKTQKLVVQKRLENDLSVLHLREVSGDLGNTYVDARSWQE